MTGLSSEQIIDHLEVEGIGVLVIGQNKGWKQSINIGDGSLSCRSDHLIAGHLRVQFLISESDYIRLSHQLVNSSYKSEQPGPLCSGHRSAKN